MRNIATTLLALTGALTMGCGDAAVLDYTADENPFVESQTGQKMDSFYYNPDGIEIEVDIEANIEAPRFRLDAAPATLAQYAMTYLQHKGVLYLESLAEDASSPSSSSSASFLFFY